MNSKFVAIAAFAAVGTSALRSAPLESYTYEQWIQDFKPETKLTSISDLMHRKNTFKANLAKIRSHNAAASAGVHSWTMDVNQFADLTESEVVAKYTGYNRSEALAASPAQFRNPYTRPSTVDLLHLPKSVDWSKIGAVSAVKNQRSCGSCWAFAAATTLESHAHIHAGYDINKEISTQQMVSCTPNPRHCGGSGGCHGATAQLAFEYLASTTGVTSESSYPYVARDTPCEFPSSSMPVDFKIAGHRDLRTNDKAELLKTIAEQGPVSVAVAAGRFAMYGGGIFDGCSKTGDNVINHAVVAIGYNVEDPLNSYLIIRNSWGPTWGEKGNIRVRLNGAEGNEKCSWNKSPQDGSACDGETDPVYVCGECGILSDSTIPLGVTLA